MPNPNDYDLGSEHEWHRLATNVNRLPRNERNAWRRQWRRELNKTANGRAVLKGIT